MSEEQTLSYDNSAETETDQNGLTPDEGDSLIVGDKMEKDQLLAGKYSNPQDLEIAYKELEKKLGEKSDGNSKEVQSKNEPTDEAPNDSEPNLLDQLWEEGTTNKLTQESFDKLKSMDPVEVAKMAMQQRAQNQSVSREFTEQDVQQIHGLVGGEENYNNMMGWANQNMSEQEVNMYDAVMDQGNPLAAYFAVQAMALKYQDMAGRDGQLVKGKAPKAQGDVFNSQAEMVQAMEDPRYNDDPAYRDSIMAKLERSNINF